MRILSMAMLWLVMMKVIAGCANEKKGNTADKVQQKETKPNINLVIDISERQLSVLQGIDTLHKYPVAVGTSKYPTPTGEFNIRRIDWNPDWTPPDSEWTEGKKFTPPGHPDNPMGRVRIVYQMPYTIHGTKNLASLGEAESHGSVRMANTDVIALAMLIMKESGTEKPASWYNTVLSDSTKMVQVDLIQKISLRNQK